MCSHPENMTSGHFFYQYTFQLAKDKWIIKRLCIM